MLASFLNIVSLGVRTQYFQTHLHLSNDYQLNNDLLQFVWKFYDQKDPQKENVFKKCV